MRVLLVAVVLTAAACGGSAALPRRGVVESDLGSWKFRRFQGPLLDVEVWVDGNQAEAFTASYITAAAEARGKIADVDLVNVFVTRYARPEGVVRATVKLARRLAQDGGYQVEETKLGGGRMLTITGRGEAWVMWPSNRHVVKVGGRGRTAVPGSMVEPYVDRYPSQLPGGALEGALPQGPDEGPARSKQDAKPEYDATNPRPDLERYDPSKVKIPDPQDPQDEQRGPPAAKPVEDAVAAPPKPAVPVKRKKPRKARP
jgi:hypothetical protein